MKSLFLSETAGDNSKTVISTYDMMAVSCWRMFWQSWDVVWRVFS